MDSPVVPISKPVDWPVSAWPSMTLYRLGRRLFGDKLWTGWRGHLQTDLWRGVGRRCLPGEFKPVTTQPDMRLNPTVGFLKTSFSEMTIEGFTEMQSRAEENIAAIDIEAHLAAKAKGKRFKVQLNGDMYENPIDDPLTQFALNPKLVAIVADYMGLTPRIHSTELHMDVPIEGDPISSQYWHWDGLDHQVVKVFAYLRDVSEATGYLATINMEQSRLHRRRLSRHRRFSKRAPERNKYVDDTIGPEHYQAHTAPAGTLIIADTANLLHRGHPQVSQPRLMFVVTYTSPLPYEEWPLRPFARLSRQHSKP